MINYIFKIVQLFSQVSNFTNLISSYVFYVQIMKESNSSSRWQHRISYIFQVLSENYYTTNTVQNVVLCLHNKMCSHFLFLDSDKFFTTLDTLHHAILYCRACPLTPAVDPMSEVSGRCRHTDRKQLIPIPSCDLQYSPSNAPSKHVHNSHIFLPCVLKVTTVA